MRYEELTIEGRNAVLEAFRSGKTIDKVFVLEGCQDGPIKTILKPYLVIQQLLLHEF